MVPDAQPQAPAASAGRPDGLRPFAKRGAVLFAAMAMLGVGLLLIIFIVPTWLMSLLQDDSCSPSGQRELASQEGFVRVHLPQAEGFGVASYSCDSGDSAHLGFTTQLTPAAARRSFLADTACTGNNLAEESAATVDCRTGNYTVELFFDRAPDGRTNGYLQFRD